MDKPGIVRVRAGKGFVYRDVNGKNVDAHTLDRIKELVIPPAWVDVWISPHENGHIQAVGTDIAGRRQYRYHVAWSKRRGQEKFAHMVDFAQCLPDLRKKVAGDLHQEGLPKTRVLALGVRLLEVGMFRIGGEEYAAEHETYGLATLEKRHVRIHDGVADFDYSAKGSKRRQITIADRDAVALLAQLKSRRAGGPGLLAWQEDGTWHDVSSHDLNVYLKDHSCGDFTAKDFRTWDATLLAAVLCAQAPQIGSVSAKKRFVAGLIREVADSLGNTPAVCRKSYIDPRILDCFECGDTIANAIKQLKSPIDLTNTKALYKIENAVIAMLTSAPHAQLVAA